MVPVEPGRWRERDEELGVVGVGTGVGHGQQPATVMLQVQVLVPELGPVNTNAACSIPIGDIAPLGHEPAYEPVELVPLVGESFVVAPAQSQEVLDRLRTMVRVQFEHHPPDRLRIPRHIQEHLWVRWVAVVVLWTRGRGLRLGRHHCRDEVVVGGAGEGEGREGLEDNTMVVITVEEIKHFIIYL